ncbi:MAG TPA: hypothetical protein DDZ80_22070 [Cyanobacteria bacterium UBA8803]|nr:hypothetical protein [Cyanobacteria bacterium UBA9273]HBL61018.1 hypothetical protein [Cyanobacteria bacterium UBA8803]
MNKLVVLSLGAGNFADGFPAVTVRLGEPGHLSMQFIGNLPPAPEIPELYRNWRLLYEALYQYRHPHHHRRGSPAIEIAETGITHMSEGEFSDISQQLKTGINTWLSAEGFLKIELQLRTQLQPAESITFVIESDDSDLWKLPWHLWDFFNTYRQAEIALSTPEYPPPVPIPPQAKSKVKILAILGDSSGINIKKDRDLLNRLPNAELTWLIEPKRQELNDRFWEQGWDILFFAGHSSSAPDATNGKIYINQHPKNNSLTIRELQAALSQAVERGLKLAIFNSCDGLGLARDLAVAQIPLPPMIVMREPVADRVAQEFLKYFLTAFAFDEPLHLAVRQAREKLTGLEDEYHGASWLPTICQHPHVVPPIWSQLFDPDLPKSFPNPSNLEREKGLIPLVKDEPTRSPLFPRQNLAKIAVIILVAGISSYLSLGAKIAPFINELGINNHRNGKLFIAQQYYHLAALLAPNYAQPYYNLGWLCAETLGDTSCAMQNFKQAAMRGLPDAYAELARLQIQQNNTQTVLQETWECLNRTPYNDVKAACLKNRGWVRWQQQRLDEAEADLRSAIALEKNSPHSYCLLAQVLAAKGNEPEALAAWQNTLIYSQYNVPEQDDCIALARQNVEIKGEE